MLAQALCVVWLVGIATLLICAAVSYLGLRNRVKTAVLLRENIYQSENVSSPFVFGFFRSRIYLPFEITEMTMENVIAHEKTHIKCFDHILKPLGYLIVTIYWFNPVIWLGYILLCRDIELACDERVIKKLDNGKRADYSEALLSCSTPHKLISACPLAFGEVGVKERIKNVLNYKRAAFWIVALAVAACVVVAVCFLTNPRTGEIEIGPFGRNYSVEAIVYKSPFYSFSLIPETAPDYRITDDYQLMILEDKNSTNWINAGTLEEVQLTEDNFDSYFRIDAIWDGASANSHRLQNKQAWKLIVAQELSESVFYYVLLQENGTLYVTYGYNNQSETADGLSDDSSIRWVFKLDTGVTTSEVYTTDSNINLECV